jgi:hypothetical protein
MKKRPETNHRKTQSQHDFSGGVRGKYARRYAAGTNVVVLEPDVSRAFPTAKAVNSSLRALAGIIGENKSAPPK